MGLRDERQKEFAEKFMETGDGILYLCPRFGKCRVGVEIFKTFNNPKILISYPDVKIKDSWEEEFMKMKYKNPNVTFTTHLSLKKHLEGPWDIFVIDECHLLSEAQIEAASNVNAEYRLGLTGTMTSFTESDLKRQLGLKVLARYPIETAIEEGVITDYEIIVRQVPLDDMVKAYKNNTRTEKGQFDALSWVIKKLDNEGKATFMLRLQRMRIIQKSLAKLDMTRKLLKDGKDERILVFCGITDIADKMGCPVYHSKKGEKDTFEAFANGKGNHLAVVKIGNTGVTYKPLNKVIINYFDSNGENLAQKINRCMAMEYNNPDKKSIIYIITSDEPVELAWLKKALEFFDKSKIKYV